MPGRAAKKAADAETRTDRELVYAARDGDMLAFDGLFYRDKDGIFHLGLAIARHLISARLRGVISMPRFAR